MSVEIIAEIAQGYEGNPQLAKLLVKGSVLTNADAVKMQIIYADELCVPSYPYYKLFKSLEMDEAVWFDLVNIVHKSNKKIYFDVYGDKSCSLAKKVGADGVKISTTDFYNLHLRSQAMANFKNIYVSIGGIPPEDIDELVRKSNESEVSLTLMHGFQAEPTPLSENNLARIGMLKFRYRNNRIGFMDHSKGDSEVALNLPIMAIGFGASVIEKHITLDRLLEIEDYISALSIDQFSKFVAQLKEIIQSVGSEQLEASAAEIEYRKKAGKIVVANKEITPGTILSDNDVCLKRVSTNPIENSIPISDMAIGKVVNQSLNENQPILKDMLI
jgi:sialic acid synthase SpsE